MRSVAAYIALLLLLTPPPAWAAPPGPEWARVEQEVLPALAGRQEVAQRQTAARRAWFAGESTLDAAFPHLAGARLDEPAVLAGRLARLDERAQERALERVQPPPALDPAQAAKLDAARQSLFDAEDEADGLERRLLLGLRGLLERHPALRADQLASLRAPLERELAQAAAASGTPEQMAAAAARAAAIDEDLRRLDALVRDLWRHATVPGAAAPDPTADLARLDDPAAAPAARARLALVRPFVDPERAGAIEAAEAAWASGAGLQAALASKSAAEAELAAARAEALADDLAAYEAALASAAADADAAAARLAEIDTSTPVGAAQAAIAKAEAEAAAIRRDAAAERVTRSKAPRGAADSADRARREAELSRQQADAARASAQGDQAERTAELLTAAATAQERATEGWSLAEAARAELNEQRSGRHADLGRLDGQVREILDSPALVGGGLDADAVYVEIRDLVYGLREETHVAADRVRETGERLAEVRARARADLAEIEVERAAMAELDASVRADRETALERWAAALTEEERAAADADAAARELRDDVLVSLIGARTLRRELRGEIGWAQRNVDRDALLRDLYAEMTLLGPTLRGMIVDRWRDMRGVPGALTSWNLLVNLLFGSIWTLLMVGGWWLARQNRGRIARAVVEQLQKRTDRWLEHRFRALQGPIEDVLAPALDLIAATLLVSRVGVPEVRFAVLIWNYVATFRLGISLYDLLFVRRTDHRPGLRALRPEAWEILRSGLRGLLLWVLVGELVQHVASNVLGLDAVAAVLRMVQWGLGAVLLVQWLHGAEPVIRPRVAALAARSSAAAWLAKGPPEQWSALRFAWALGSTSFVAAGWAMDLSWRLGSEGSGLGRVLNLVGRYRMTRTSNGEAAPLPAPPALIERLVVAECPAEARIARTEVASAVRDAFADWQREKRRGLVAVVGDRGDGKRTSLDDICAELAKEHRVVRRRIDTRLVTTAQGLAWVADLLSLKLDDPSTAETVKAVEQLPPSIIVVEGLELAFLRTVGGFDALRALVYVMNATGDEHFWIVSAHRPAWRYLARLGELVNLEVFRSVIEIPPLGESALRELATKRLDQAGATADFSGLVRHGPFGDDPAVELDRTTSLFYRLLGEASGGNAAVALRMYGRCLSPRPGAEGVYDVRLAAALTDTTLPALSDNDLFVLTALRTQSELTEDEVASTTNMHPAATRAVVRRLQSLNILARDGDRLSITWEMLPRVTRLLRRRHFIQWTV